jgi:hypothetical protein
MAFATKLADVVGLYIDPPAHAVVLSIDEYSQNQALDRTQPGLPIKGTPSVSSYTSRTRHSGGSRPDRARRMSPTSPALSRLS